MTIDELKEKAKLVRTYLIELASKESIHIGGDLSSADIMTALWQYKMWYNPLDPKDESRDRFVLSKGHASALLNIEQAMVGCYPLEDVFAGYAKDGGQFAMHACNMKNRYIEVSTGSLGHGLPVACGIAAGMKLKGCTGKVYVLMGDGEQSEGSIWEAAMNASRYKLNNIVAIIDNNNLQSDGFINDLTGLGDIAEKYRAFGWNAVEINGNDMEQVVTALDGVKGDKPTVIVAHTVKGCGVDFMENNVRWHAGKLSPEQYQDAMKSVGGAE